jgi:predicted N-acetyltransferase YhbS
MNILKFEKQNSNEVIMLWNSCFLKQYHIDEFLFNEKLLNDPDLFWPSVLVCKTDSEQIIGFIACKISDGKIEEYKNAAWVSVLFVHPQFRRHGIGSQLYLNAEKELHLAGVRKIFLGGEIRNFFSGIPEPFEIPKAFFLSKGFDVNNEQHYDLCADVSKIDFDKLTITYNKSAEYVTRPFNEKDLSALEKFFDSEFPGRWKFEMTEFIRGGKNLNHLLVFCKEEEIKGFCKINAGGNSNGLGINLGKGWGALGPIGISKDLRGKGFGNRLLYDSLKYLKKLGAKNVNIDWTVLKDFYGQFGFSPWRSYLGAYKILGEQYV